MFQGKIPFCYGILGKFIGSDVVYTTRCILINFEDKSVDDIKIFEPLKSNILCLCENEIALIGDNLDEIKINIKFLNIELIKVDDHFGKLFQIVIKPADDYSLLKDQLTYSLVVDNRERFLENLECQYSIFFSRNFNTDKVLKKNNETIRIKTWKKFQNPETPKKIFELFEEEKNENIMKKNIPENHIYDFYKNYMYYLESGYEHYASDTYEYKNEENSCKLIIDVQKETSIENLLANSEVGDFSFYCYNQFYKLINEKLVQNTFWITRNTSYMKKTNLTKDKAQWEGWIIEARFLHKENIGINVVFLCLRRKYLPPFFETYQDISFTLIEKFDANINIELSSKSRQIIELLADSISPRDYFIPYEECNKLINIKIDCYLLDYDSLQFLYNNLNIRGHQSYILGTDMVLKMMMFMSEYQKNIINLIKGKLIENLKKFMEELGQKFREKNHEEQLKNTGIKKLIGDNDLYMFNYLSATPDNTFFWYMKRSEFFVSCFDGLLTGGFVDIRKLITWFKEIPEMRNLNSHLIDLLSIKIEIKDKEKKKIVAIVDSIVNHIHRIKKFYFNEKILCILIEKDYLRILHNNTNNNSYSEFLLYLLENHYSNKLFKSIYYFIKTLNKNNLALENQDEVKKKTSSNNKCYSILTEFFFKKFSDPLQGSIINTLSCKGLINLISIDVFNEKKLIDLNILTIICDKLSSPDEKLVYYSAELLLSFLKSKNLNPYLNKFIKDHNNLILKLFKILKGSDIPGCYYSSKTILLIFEIIESLVSLSQSYVKEFICDEKNAKIIKYILSYLREDITLHPENIFHEIMIFEKIFNILKILITKNIDYACFLEQQFNLLKLLDLFFEKHFKKIFFESIFHHDHNVSCTALFEEYEVKMFFFSFTNFFYVFISESITMKIKINTFCPTIKEIFLLIKDSIDSEFLKHPCPECTGKSVVNSCEHIKKVHDSVKFIINL